MMMRNCSYKMKKIAIGISVLAATIMYVLVSSALAASSSLTGLSYDKAYLSLSDVWEFSSKYAESSYSAVNSGQTSQTLTPYTSTSGGTTSTTFDKYVSDITVKKSAAPTVGSGITKHPATDFNSGYSQSTVASSVSTVGDINTLTTTGTGVYSVVPSRTGDYYVYVYSPGGVPAAGSVSYSVVESAATNNSFSFTDLTFTGVGNGWYQSSAIPVSQTGWGAWDVSLSKSNPLAWSNQITTKVNGSTVTNDSTFPAKSYTSTILARNYTNTWTVSEVKFDSVIVLKWNSSVQLGPIGHAVSFSYNNGSGGTVSAQNMFGGNVDSGSSLISMPVLVTAAPNDGYIFTGFSGANHEDLTQLSDTQFRYDFSGDTSITATWEQKRELPSVTVSGNGSTSALSFYLTPTGSNDFTTGEVTDYSFLVNFTGAESGATVDYTVVSNGSTLESGTLSSTSEITTTAVWEEIVVTLTAKIDGTAIKTITYTITPSGTGLTPVAIYYSGTSGTNNATYYYFLEDALENTSSGRIVLLRDYTFKDAGKASWGSKDGGAGYTVKSGVTLIIPQDSSANSVVTGTKTEDHTYACETQVGYVGGILAKPDDGKAYCELTIPNGVNLNVASGGLMAVGGATNGYCGIVNAATIDGTAYTYQHGNVKVESGATITVKGRLSSCGFIYGDGLVTAVSGAEIYVPFTVHDFRGGGYVAGAAGKLNTSYGITPISGEGNAICPFIRYSFLAIQCNQHIVSGASVTAYADLYTTSTSSHNNSKVPIIGNDANSCLFTLTGTNTYVNISYDESIYASVYPQVGKMYLDLHGDAAFGGLTLDIDAVVTTVTVDTRKVNFVLPYNFDLDISDGVFSIPNKIMILPGASVTLHEGATMNVSAALTVYDGLHDYTANPAEATAVVLTAYKSGDYANYTNVSPSNTYPSSAVLMSAPFYGSGSADFVVDGTLNLNDGSSLGGIVQTTSGGSARIHTASGIGTSTCTQVGVSGYWNFPGIFGFGSKDYALAGATVRTLEGQVLDMATGKRVNLVGGTTYQPSAGSEKLTSYTYDLYYYSQTSSTPNKTGPHETITENVALMLQGSWWCYNVIVKDSSTDEQVSTFKVAANADISSMGFYSNQSCTTPSTTITSDNEIVYVKGTEDWEAKVIWASGAEATLYPTLRLAVKDAIHSGDRIVLLKDQLGYESVVSAGSDQSLILDLNGHTFTYKSTPFVSNSGGTLTVELNGGVISNNVDGTHFDFPAFSNITNESTLNVLLNGGTISVTGDGTNLLSNGGISIQSGSNMVVDLGGGTWSYLTGLTAGNTAYNGKAMFINDGIMTVTDSVGGGKLTTDVNTTNTSLTNYTSVIRNNLGATLYFNGGELELSLAGSTNSKANVLNFGTIIAKSESDVVLRNGRGFGIYNSGGTVTIDLNGKTWSNISGLSGASSAYRGLAAVTNTGTLTIQDSSGNGNGKITTDLASENGGGNYGSCVRNNAGGTLTIRNVTLEMSQLLNENNAVIMNYNGGTIASLDQVVINSGRGYCIFNYGGTISEIKNCEMTGLKGIQNRNLRGANTLAAGYNISQYGKIVLIKDTDITVSQYGLMNYAVIDEVNGCTITAHPDSAQVDTMGNGLPSALTGNAACYAVYNGNAWWYDNNKWKQADSGLTRTIEYREEEAYRPTIGKIVGCTVLAENTSTSADHGYALYNEGGIIGEISGTTTIKSYKHPSNGSNIASNYALRNTAGGIIKSIAGTVTISATGYSAIYNDSQFTAKVVYTYPVTVGTNSTHEVTTYGAPSTITSISCGGTVSAGSQYAVYNNGYIGSITGGATYQSNYDTILNSGQSAVSSIDYVRKYTDTADAATEYERVKTTVRNLDKGGVIGTISGITVTGTGTKNYRLLSNYGYIGVLSDSSFTSTSAYGGASYPLLLNGNERHASLTETIKTSLTSETNSHLTVTSGVATSYERDYAYDVPTIGTMSGVTISSSSTYAFKNYGKVTTMSGCTVTATQYSVVNDVSGSYAERHYLQYYSGSSIFATNKSTSNYERAYKRNPAEITTIDNCTITTPANTYALYNAGHIGTIQNSTVTAGTTTAKNSAIYNGGDCITEYSYNLEEILYVTANSTTACTASYGQSDETKVETYAYGVPTIDLIGANNTISGASEVIKNYGVITAIDSGTDQATKVTASTQKGNAVYNLTGTLKSRTSTTPYTSGTAGTKTNADTYFSANIGTVKNLCITSNGYGILNGSNSSSSTYLPTIGELGEGLEIQANCTTADYAPVHNTTNAQIEKITGGIYTAAKAGTYAYKNANTNAAHATEISGGDFKGGTASRDYAIYQPDTTTRQTYPTGKTLSTNTRTVAATGYYYITDNVFTIKFNANGGDGSISDRTNVSRTSSVDLPDGTGLTRANWVFCGWGLEQNTGADKALSGTVTQANLGSPGTGDEVTLYAIWKPDKVFVVTVSWDTMSFTYTPTKYQWNGAELKYEVKEAGYWSPSSSTAPKVTVTNEPGGNHGPVKAEIRYVGNTGYTWSAIDFTVGANTTQNTVTLSESLDAGNSVEASVMLTGEPEGTGGTYNVGTLQLTLTPAG